MALQGGPIEQAVVDAMVRGLIQALIRLTEITDVSLQRYSSNCSSPNCQFIGPDAA